MTFNIISLESVIFWKPPLEVGIKTRALHTKSSKGYCPWGKGQICLSSPSPRSSIIFWKPHPSHAPSPQTPSSHWVSGAARSWRVFLGSALRLHLRWRRWSGSPWGVTPVPGWPHLKGAGDRVHDHSSTGLVGLDPRQLSPLSPGFHHRSPSGLSVSAQCTRPLEQSPHFNTCN